MKVLALIPARYNSTRFPGKPLVMIQGKSMIQRVYEQCKKVKGLEVVVATDDARIADHVKEFKGKFMLTGEHDSGTSRCIEVVEQLEDEGSFYDLVLNVQGDEPFIDPKQIELVIAGLKDASEPEIISLCKRISTKEELFNSNVVKVVMTDEDPIFSYRDALYFSRHPIPFVRDTLEGAWLDQTSFYKHIGLYGFRKDVLLELQDLETSPLSLAESLEQLTWLANDYLIGVVETTIESIGIDTPDDINNALRMV